MALPQLARPSPSRALLISRLSCISPAAMQATRCSSRSFRPSKFLQGFSLCRCNLVVQSTQRCFCSSSVSQQYQAGGNASNVTSAHQQQVAGSFTAHSEKEQQRSRSMQQSRRAYTRSQQEPAYPSSNTTHQQQQQPQHSIHGGTPSDCSPSPQQPNASAGTSMSGTSPHAGTSSLPRTSAAAEVIDKYLGPSTLKLDKGDKKSLPPHPPPPQRNYGPQGTQEKKSGKDLVAESAACAVIEKYLGPWPGFPPRDPKIDEYLDSLPENAACAAIDKYFGPYKPLFVFKKNEENANSPPAPTRPSRNRMTSRARNRAWNSSQQGASADRPWTASPQQGSTANVTGGYQDAPTATVSPLLGATLVYASQSSSAQQGEGGRPVPSPSGTMVSQSAGVPPNQYSTQQQEATTATPSQMQAPQWSTSNQ